MEHNLGDCCCEVVAGKTIKFEETTVTLDKVFDQNASQESVYEFVGQPVIEDIMEGYNATIFAYGQTGSGKTYTMFGPDVYDEVQQGIIPRVSTGIFKHWETNADTKEIDVRCSMLEIYKENLRDLLTDECVELKIKESRQKGIYVEGLFESPVISDEELMCWIKIGDEKRVWGETRQNSVSSRSHLIFIVRVTQTFCDDTQCTGILNLVDLAGSEKVGKSGAIGKVFKEGTQINLSLSVLGNVIHSITVNSEHIPYRESKLTRLLQESLGGNYKTALVVTCSPHSSQLQESISTLKFAQRTKKIKNKVKINIKDSPEQLQKRIEELINEIRKRDKRINELMSENHSICRDNNLTLSNILGKIPEDYDQEMYNSEHNFYDTPQLKRPTNVKDEDYSQGNFNSDYPGRITNLEVLQHEFAINSKSTFQRNTDKIKSFNQHSDFSKFDINDISSIERPKEINQIKHDFNNIPEKYKNKIYGQNQRNNKTYDENLDEEILYNTVSRGSPQLKLENHLKSTHCHKYGGSVQIPIVKNDSDDYNIEMIHSPNANNAGKYIGSKQYRIDNVQDNSGNKLKGFMENKFINKAGSLDKETDCEDTKKETYNNSKISENAKNISHPKSNFYQAALNQRNLETDLKKAKSCNYEKLYAEVITESPEKFSDSISKNSGNAQSKIKSPINKNYKCDVIKEDYTIENKEDDLNDLNDLNNYSANKKFENLSKDNKSKVVIQRNAGNISSKTADNKSSKLSHKKKSHLNQKVHSDDDLEEKDLSKKPKTIGKKNNKQNHGNIKKGHRKSDSMDLDNPGCNA